MPANLWVKEAISVVYSNYIFAGVEIGEFAPFMTATREQYAQFLYNAL
ncbi:S-layer homology domain-containing protein [Bacillus cereus]|nr:S-layer homology domain-containing protein [Bacillus cereus]